MALLTVRELARTEWQQWDDWLSLQSNASPFVSACWLDANVKAFGGRPMLLAVFDEGQYCGGVALRVTDVGPVHIVRPSMWYNSLFVVGKSDQRRQHALEALLKEMEHQRLLVRPLPCTTDIVDLRQAIWRGWTVTVGWTVMQSLQSWSVERDVLAAEVRQLRKSQRIGVKACVETPDADLLHDLVRESLLRRKAAVQADREQTSILMRAYGERGIQVVARDSDGRPLSASYMIAQDNRTAYCLWIGTSALGLIQGATVAMYVATIEELKKRGYEYLDWCGGSLPGLSDFKLKFGGILRTRLTVSRMPFWLKALYPSYMGLLSLKRRLESGRS